MPYTLELSPDMDSILRTRASRRGLTPEDYLRTITEDRLRPRRGANGLLTSQEREDVTLLNAELSPDFWRRYSELTGKLSAGTLTETEGEEIKQLTAREEAWSGKRIALLQPMARKRQISLLELMKRNGIRHHPDADRFLGADS